MTERSRWAEADDWRPQSGDRPDRDLQRQGKIIMLCKAAGWFRGVMRTRAGSASSTVLVAALLLLGIAAEGRAQARDTNPLEAGKVLDDIVPQPGALIPYGVPQGWFDFKDDVYDRIGLRFGFSYQMLGQAASDVLPDATYDTALGETPCLRTSVSSTWAVSRRTSSSRPGPSRSRISTGSSGCIRGTTS
jgi:hypothetical protein